MVRKLAPTLITTNGNASTVCANTRPSTEPAIRQLTNTANIPIATITNGTIIGDNTSALTNSFPGNRPRTNPNAARVPSTVAVIQVSRAT